MFNEKLESNSSYEQLVYPYCIEPSMLLEDQGELKENSDPQRIDDMKKKYPHDADLISRLRNEKENYFSKGFMQTIDGKLWEKDMINAMAEQYPVLTIASFPMYYKKNYSQEIIKALIDISIMETRLSKNYGKNTTHTLIETLFSANKQEPYAYDLFGKVINENPDFAFRYYEFYKTEGYAAKLIENTFENLQQPEVFFDYFLLYKSVTKNKEKADNLLKEKLAYMIDKSPSLLVKYFDLYKDKEYVAEYIDVLLKNHKTELLFLYYTDRKYINEIPLLKNFLDEFIQYFSGKELLIANQKVILSFPTHLNLFAGLLKTGDAIDDTSIDQQRDWNTIKEQYEKNLVYYIAQGKEMSDVNKEHVHVFILRASEDGGDDYNLAIEKFSKEMTSYYKSLTIEENFKDYSSYREDYIGSPAQFIADIENTIKEYPDDTIYVHLGLHGFGADFEKEGSARYKNGEFTQESFNALFNLPSQKVSINITSCNSSNKDHNYKNNMIKSINRDSGYQPSSAYGEEKFLDAFNLTDQNGKYEADYDGDGLVNHNEAMIYRMIKYNISLTPITFDHNGKAIDISMNEYGLYNNTV